jgi:hypothetical protein
MKFFAILGSATLLKDILTYVSAVAALVQPQKLFVLARICRASPDHMTVICASAISLMDILKTYVILTLTLPGTPVLGAQEALA